MAGWGTGLLVAFWIGIGSIITQTSSTSLLPSGCKPILSDNTTAATVATTTTAAIQAAFSNITKRYQPRLHPSVVLISQILSSLLLSQPSALKRFYSLSYMWYSAFNCFTVITVGLMVSFLTGIPYHLQTRDFYVPRSFSIISFPWNTFKDLWKKRMWCQGQSIPCWGICFFFYLNTSKRSSAAWLLWERR